MSLTFDLYWSFRSPYSYLLTRRVRALTEEFDVNCNVRVVYPLAVRSPEFFETRDPLWGAYFSTDVFREAALLDLPLRWPRPDPVFRAPDGSYPNAQPYIHRLTHLGVAAAEAGKGLAFLDEVGRLIWGGAVDGWHEVDHLSAATSRAGLDFRALTRDVDADPSRFAAVVEASQAAQREAGHWGVPLMVFGGEPFFGQDRFNQMKWRMVEQGLSRRR